MSSIITGLFHSQKQSAKISADLENAGFHDSSYIMYLHEKPISKEIKTSIWQSFFHDKTQLEDDNLVISVRVAGSHENEKVTEIFKNNEVRHQNFLENITLKDAQSLKYLKRVAAIRAKALIYSPPKINHHGKSPGINSEVLFGKNG